MRATLLHAGLVPAVVHKHNNAHTHADIFPRQWFFFQRNNAIVLRFSRWSRFGWLCLETMPYFCRGSVPSSRYDRRNQFDSIKFRFAESEGIRVGALVDVTRKPSEFRFGFVDLRCMPSGKPEEKRRLSSLLILCSELPKTDTYIVYLESRGLTIYVVEISNINISLQGELPCAAFRAV